MRRDVRAAGRKAGERRNPAFARLAEAGRAGAGNDEHELRASARAARAGNAAAEENVLFGLDNLHSYQCVQARLGDGSLGLHGWFFKIATAELFAYDPEMRQFVPLVREP